jgi:hypothetical protein
MSLKRKKPIRLTDNQIKAPSNRSNANPQTMQVKIPKEMKSIIGGKELAVTLIALIVCVTLLVLYTMYK